MNICCELRLDRQQELESLNLIFIGPCIVMYSYSTTNKMHLLSQIILVKCLHVSDGLSVHHQELKNAYTATVYGKELLLPVASSRYQQLFDIYLCCIRSFELLMMDGKTVRNR